ncbi:hypothetical protein Sru01_54930 [Sphaerisporangium rufum]|uniref:XRE family transcriptional regulator n=1 Tax=Sphaerisporangium rufum TaxID=1381558 RepID=A0A919R6C5_9ACTN|nr:hypothetical protein [Sphaerisporangium rufum]GII80511.1 hypothetical protein Sru01_54930 [Sphaerisporangium rufum]
MTGEGYRVLLAARRRSDVLRAKGFTYDQIAEVHALDHDVSPLRLYRFAHGRTVADVVNAFNDLDPAGTATLREARLYDYEIHPRPGGRRPPVRALTTLARIYQTHARSLVAPAEFSTYISMDRQALDLADYRHLDRKFIRVSSGKIVCANMESKAAWLPGVPDVSLGVQAEQCADLLSALGAEEGDVKRRDLLLELALSLGGLPALALLRHLSSAETARMTAITRAEGRLDESAVAVLEKLTAQCRRLDDDLGPRGVVPVVDAKRRLAARLLHRESLSPALRERLVSVYAELSQLSGYLHYDLAEYELATLRFKDALEAALESGNATLLAYIHHWLSDMASFRGESTKALDHAYAAQGWAKRSPSRLLRARTQFVEAWALALEGEQTASLRLLETARSVAKPTDADPSYLYWVAESSALGGTAAGFCLNALRLPDAAISTVNAQLNGIGGSGYSRTRAFALIQYATALVQKKEIPQAAAVLTEAAQISASHSSARLLHSLRISRGHLQPWAGYTYVNTLDRKLAALGIGVGTQ